MGAVHGEGVGARGSSDVDERGFSKLHVAVRRNMLMKLERADWISNVRAYQVANKLIPLFAGRELVRERIVRDKDEFSGCLREGTW